MQRIAAESAAFSGRVYLLNGDSHRYVVHRPLASGSSWPAAYGAVAADNLTRVTVDGGPVTTAGNYLRVTVTISIGAMTFTRVSYTS